MKTFLDSRIYGGVRNEIDEKVKQFGIERVIGVEVFQVDVDVIQPFVFLGIGRMSYFDEKDYDLWRPEAGGDVELV